MLERVCFGQLVDRSAMAVTEDGPEDETHDERADDGGDPEQPAPEPEDVVTLLRSRSWRAVTGAASRDQQRSEDWRATARRDVGGRCAEPIERVASTFNPTHRTGPYLTAGRDSWSYTGRNGMSLRPPSARTASTWWTWVRAASKFSAEAAM